MYKQFKYSQASPKSIFRAGLFFLFFLFTIATFILQEKTKEREMLL